MSAPSTMPVRSTKQNFRAIHRLSQSRRRAERRVTASPHAFASLIRPAYAPHRMSLTRFGVAMETSLLSQFDQLVQERGCTRSELFRDLARAEIIRSLANRRVDAFASVTIVYNHHVRELSERLTQMQHQLGDQVRSTMHVHLDDERCLEVIVMRGRADRLQKVAETLFATRGVVQGSIEIVIEGAKAATHSHAHDEEAAHHHGEPKRRAPRATMKPHRRSTRT